jgi:glycosyltransferase involved in cell wall biosynthesis
MKNTVSVIMSAYDEEKTVGKVLEKLRSLDYVTEIIVVDNGSTDQTYERILEAQEHDGRIKCFQIKKNRGLGCGLRMAIESTTGDIVVRQDADLEYDPEELIDLVMQIENGNADVVYGSRLLVRKAHKVHYYYAYLANIVITTLSNIFTNLFLSDVETAAKAFCGPLIRALGLKSERFEIENEITIKLNRMGCIFYEIPFSYYGRTFEEGKKIKFIDGIRAIYYILYWAVGTWLKRPPHKRSILKIQ